MSAMKLKTVTVKLFRNVLDSTEVAIQPDVTCLVGKNESGKTSFLQALRMLNPAQSADFDISQHYPAWLEKRHRMRGDELEAVVPVTAVFEIEASDTLAFAKRFGDGVLKSTTLTLSRTYGNELIANDQFEEFKLLSMGKAAIDSAAGLGELADQLGITTDGLQALQYSAVQNGVKLSQLEQGIQTFGKNIGQAAEGNKAMIDSLNNLGVKILDVQGNLRPTESILQNVAAGIVAIQDPAKQVATAVEFFGRSGARLIPMLGDVASGLDTMKGAAQRAGVVISDEAIAKLDALSDASERSTLKIRELFAENAAGPLEAYEHAVDPLSDEELTRAAQVLLAEGISIAALHAKWAKFRVEGMGKLAKEGLAAAEGQQDLH
jgi:energy-coupling factor transporter ATP-binding protein EcfA2